jgi:uncharacterized protein YcfL
MRTLFLAPVLALLCAGCSNPDTVNLWLSPYWDMTPLNKVMYYEKQQGLVYP